MVKKKKKEFIENVHYYLEGERIVFTEQFHLERGQCCGTGCRHTKGTIDIKKKDRK